MQYTGCSTDTWLVAGQTVAKRGWSTELWLEAGQTVASRGCSSEICLVARQTVACIGCSTEIWLVAGHTFASRGCSTEVWVVAVQPVASRPFLRKAGGRILSGAYGDGNGLDTVACVVTWSTATLIFHGRSYRGGPVCCRLCAAELEREVKYLMTTCVHLGLN